MINGYFCCMNLRDRFRWASRLFLKGLLLALPTMLLVMVLVWVYQKVDRLAQLIFPPIDTPILRVSFLILLVFISLAAFGYFATTVFAKPMKRWLHRTLDKAPFLKTIYTSINDLLKAFVGNKKKFNQPVLVRLTKETEVQKMGFITQDDLTDLGVGPEMVAVYLPHSFNFSGNLFIVPKENITPIDAKSGEIMKFIVSGGISDESHQEEMRELVEKQTPYEGWVLVVVVLSLGVLAYARSTEYRRFISMFQAYFDTRYFREVIREEGVIGNTSTVLLLINGILQLGLFSNAFLNQFSIESGFLTYLTIVGFILVWYVLKGAVQKVLGVVY